MPVLFAPLISWLTAFAAVYVLSLTDAGVKFAQTMFNSAIDFAIYVISLFPDCLGACLEVAQVPVTSTTWYAFLAALNWLFPVTFFISLINFMTCGLLAFVTIAPVARWLKLIT